MRHFLASAVLFLSATSAQAVSVTVEAFVSFDFTATASDEFGAATTPSIGTSGGIFAETSESLSVLNTFTSLGDSDSLRLENTSTTDIIGVSWTLVGFATVVVDIAPDTIVDPTNVEVTSFAGATDDLSEAAFAAVIESYTCSASDLADPAISCDGVSGFSTSDFFETGFLTLDPGDVFIVGVETAPLVIVSTEIAPVPLPAGGALLLGGLLGLSTLRVRRLWRS
ncbi:MAG: hypothetical protein AAF376_18300 [Pseudomonadota bacterium]